MKKQISIFFTLLFLLISNPAMSQNEKDQLVLTAGYGFNVVKTLVRVQFNDALFNKTHSFDDASVQGSGPLILGADYGITERISAGLHFATQAIRGTVIANQYTDENNVFVTENPFKYQLRRSHISILPKFHYIIANDKIDLYSGLRLGYVIWNKRSDSKDPNFNTLFNDLNNRVSIGLLAFGGKYYIRDNFGVSAEINIGPPYTFALGINYRSGGGK